MKWKTNSPRISTILAEPSTFCKKIKIKTKNKLESQAIAQSCNQRRLIQPKRKKNPKLETDENYQRQESSKTCLICKNFHLLFP